MERIKNVLIFQLGEFVKPIKVFIVQFYGIEISDFVVAVEFLNLNKFSFTMTEDIFLKFSVNH